MEGKIDMREKSDWLAQVIPAADSISHQAGSVVSKTLVNRPAGTITLFAFAEGQGLSEHTAPFDAVVYLLDGEAEIIISGTSYYLKENEMIIMPAHEPHALQAIKPFKMMLIMIKS